MAYLRNISLVAAGVLALTAAGSAQGAVAIVGGGAAEACSKAAFKGKADWRAEEVCTNALDNEPLTLRDQAGTHVNRGVLRLRAGSYDSAASDFDAAVRLQPELGEAYVNRGVLLMAEERYADALAQIDKGIEYGVEEPAKAYYNRALAYEGLDDARNAYENYRKAQELAPEWAAPAKMLTRFSVRTRAGG